MRVGIDARLLSEKVTGIGRYTAELTRKLVEQPGEFYIYSPQPVVAGSWRQDNVVLRSGNFRSRAGRMLWSQSCLPFWAAKDRVNVFWGTTHRLPRYLPDSVARVVTIHDLVWKHAGETMRPLSRWLEKKLMPEALRLADRVIADSYSTLNGLVEEFPESRDRIRVVYPGATELPEPLGFQSLADLGIDRPYFLFVGTLEPRKNLRRLLEAFSHINGTIRNKALLVIAGGKGWGGVDLDTLVRERGLVGNVLAVGYVNDAQLATLYSHALFLAMPSIYEGFGLPLVEAMSFGVPVLTSATSSLPEVAGDAGILVDPLDAFSIANGLMCMLGNDVNREQLAAKAKARAERFTWEKAARETWAVFQEAVAARQSRGGGES